MNKYEKLLSLPPNFTIESSDAGEQLAYQKGVKDALKLVLEDFNSYLAIIDGEFCSDEVFLGASI